MSTRQRKGKGGQTTPSQRGASEELNSSHPPPPREHRGSPPPRAAASSSSSGLQWLLWPLLALLAGALGALAWLHLAQRDGLIELGKEVLDLRSKLPRELQGLREQILQDQDGKHTDAADVEQRILDLEAAWRFLEEKLEKATAAAKKALASDTAGKLSALQSELKKSLLDIREELPSSTDLSRVENQVELIKSTHLEKLSQNVAEIWSDHASMKGNVTTMTNWLTSSASTMQEYSQNLQELRQDMGAVSDSLEASLDFLSEKVESLEKGFNQTSQTVVVLHSQLERSKEDLTSLREVAASQRQDHIVDSQQLENIRDVIKQLDMEKHETEEEVNSIKQSIADQKRETQNKMSELGSALEVLQARAAQVETGATSQNTQLSEAVEQELQSLRKGLDKVESGIQQCLSGEVQTYCETAENCGWPHLREVNFPHRILTEPTITVGVSSLSAQGSVGLIVKAIDITDSGFKIQISNIGEHHLSSVKVTWMLCA